MSGTIGNTNPLKLITINSDGNAGEIVTLSGAVVRAANINVNDDGATATTLILNNGNMVLTGNITPTTNIRVEGTVRTAMLMD